MSQAERDLARDVIDGGEPFQICLMLGVEKPAVRPLAGLAYQRGGEG